MQRREPDGAAQCRRAFPHPGQAVALRRPGRTAAVVVDRDGELPGVGPFFRHGKHDGGPAGTGVPHHVGESLLHDPVSRFLHDSRNRPFCPMLRQHLKVHLQPGTACVLRELGKLAQPRS